MLMNEVGVTARHRHIMSTTSRKLKRRSEEFYNSPEGDSLWNDGVDAEPKRKKLDQKLAINRCDSSFYSQSCESLARALLGCQLVRVTSTATLRATIVETEAYLGGEDKASHSYDGKRTPRNEAMYMPPGTCYVYSVYGTHSCLNISSFGEGAAVLIRALEPVSGLEHIRRLRLTKKDKDLCNGPAKLCQAMAIDKSFNKEDLTSCESLWVEPRSHDLTDETIMSTGRIGVDYAGSEWATKPLRFYIHGNINVSKL